MSERQDRIRRILLDELADARNAEVLFSGENGSDEHICVTGRVLDALAALRDAGFHADADLDEGLPVECDQTATVGGS